jgi:hypothetical protein
VPGIDMLEGSNIRRTGKDPHMLFTIRQLASVSHQLGRRAFCEAYGVAGWDSTFEHYKRFGDWLMVNGVNFIDQHLSFSTIRGARKRDHPQSFSDVSPWWPYYRLHADHVARVSYLSTRSEARNRVLLLQQTTSGFLRARRAGPTPELNKMREDNAALNQFLADRQVDFDLGDEYMIEWFGAQQAKRFAIAKAAYDLLVWPENMDNVRKQSIPHLERYLAAGGEILALSEPASLVDGRPDAAVAKLAAKYAAQWVRVGGHEELVTAIRKRLKPRIRFETDPPSGVGSFDRYLAGGDRVLFLANTGLEPVKLRAAVEGSSLEVLDTVTGKISPAVYTADAGTLRFDVDLEPAGSQMFLVAKAAGKPAVRNVAAFTPVEVGPWQVKADAPNVLVLDYCDLVIGTEKFVDTNTWRANWTLWQRHGFERPAWDNAVQFRTAVFDRNHFAKDSGFEAAFRFDVSEGSVLKDLELGVENPELYRIKVNGELVSFATARRWLDPHLRSARIGAMARTGSNVVTVTGRPFDVKMELENIYLRGSFAVEHAVKGFRIAAPAKLGFGSWAAQGYPFYGESVTYETSVAVPAGASRLRLSLKEWQGSVAVVLLDGKEVGRLGWQPYEAEFAAAPGKHVLQVKVVSTPRNTMGPFHNPTKPRMRAWPAAWSEFPSQQPAGPAYDVLGYGLIAAPAIGVARN